MIEPLISLLHGGFWSQRRLKRRWGRVEEGETGLDMLGESCCFVFLEGGE